MTHPGILVVCTGNLCRSPLAGLLLEAGLRELGATTPVSTAGTGAVVGAAMAREEAAFARQRGLDPSGHVARAVDPDEVRGSALVLTMTRAQRAEVVAGCPEAVRRVFTLLEFRRLLGASAPSAGSVDGGPEGTFDLDAALPGIVELAAGRRGLVPVEPPDADDIDDPIGRPAAVHERVAHELATSVRSVLDSVARLSGRPAA